MNFPNPTPIVPGMYGTFAGRRYRVAGRVVLGMEVDGENYYWNEFNLVADDKSSATLVYEQTEDQGEWRWFTMFEPRDPLSVLEATAMRVGQILNLEGERLRVTLVDESRVYYVEGTAPEGVEAGDVAGYFNAESGSEMIVVSWTGEEIEHFRGSDLPASVVAAAFGLPADRFAGAAPKRSSGSSAGKIICLLVSLAVVIGGIWIFESKPRSRQLVKSKTPSAPLALGAVGKLDGVTWNIAMHSVVEMALVNQIYDQHEYQLFASEGGRATLVYRLNDGAAQWILYRPLEPPTALSPEQAAAKRVGEKVPLDDRVIQVTDLFRSTLLTAQSLEGANDVTGSVRYGFIGRSGPDLCQANWNSNNLALYAGKILSTQSIARAFQK